MRVDKYEECHVCGQKIAEQEVKECEYCGELFCSPCMDRHMKNVHEFLDEEFRRFVGMFGD